MLFVHNNSMVPRPVGRSAMPIKTTPSIRPCFLYSLILYLMFYSAPSGGDVGGERFLIMSEVRQAAVFRMELNGSEHTRYPIASLSNPIAVAFEPFGNSIFVTERGSASAASPKTITKYGINANSVKRSLPRSKYFLVSEVTFGTILYWWCRSLVFCLLSIVAGLYCLKINLLNRLYLCFTGYEIRFLTYTGFCLT